MNGIKNIFRKVFGRKKDTGPPVAQLLSELSEEHIVFSGMLHNHSEIDHVVFNRKHGLFVINTFKDKGEVSYNGNHLFINKKQRSEAITKTLKDTFWLKASIRDMIGMDVHITSVVVFENAKVKISEPIIGVMILESKDLPDVIIKALERKALEDGVVMALRELHGTHTINYRRV